ncbi:MAG: ribosome biogenesis GTPase Der [Candidatus Fischerbacteria bacterium RBG_13_37_8]|uniref:GTPase Der n=1 Tax=Candidatus Fischerbacteria bacterium RBG_13_37_8 TaxID=1817863 RepID=A0A1F5V9K6_9BACT|nr:MAG: ribosome biogenesis GTPase Der [Candidatus Fischerbacteria bacterium RBG_13_37_8]
MQTKSIITITGRPNVGKSTLFNRIIGKRHAIVTPIEGTTRDRLYGSADWRGNNFTVIDTGGWMPKSADSIEQLINDQIDAALHESHIILFVCSGKEGCTALDKEIAQKLRKYNKPVFLCINKMDIPEKNYQHDPDFYALGFEDMFNISAEHGLGVDEILDKCLLLLPEIIDSDKEDSIKIAIIGKPNVGKSSILNALLGENRVIISEMPGTTRDSIDITFHYKERIYCFIDTAGIKKKSKARDLPELISIIKAKQMIEKADIILLVLDCMEEIHHIDAELAGYALKHYKPLALIINKIDLLPDKNAGQKLINLELKDRLSFIHFAPHIYVSAKTNEHIDAIFLVLENLYNAYSQRIATHELNELLASDLTNYTLGHYKNTPVKVKYMTQIFIKPPTFALFLNKKAKVQKRYHKYLENIIRKRYDSIVVPIKLIFKFKQK